MLLSINKRQKIIISAAILSIVLVSTRLIPISFYITYRFLIILSFGLLAYLLALWALWNGISKLRAIVLLILPTYFAVAVASYYFLLPVRWVIRLPVAGGFGLAFYILLLSQNIFSVSSLRTIPLYRVASTTVLFLTLFTSLLLFNVVYSFNLLFTWNGIIVFLLSFPLVLQVLWSVEMEKVSALIVVYSAVISLVIGEVGLALSFWPIYHPLASVILVAVMHYFCLGLVTDSLRDRLSRGAVYEYLGWGTAIVLIAFFVTFLAGQ